MDAPDGQDFLLLSDILLILRIHVNSEETL